MTQAPTPGPLDSESVKLLVKGDLLQWRGTAISLVRFHHANVIGVQVIDPRDGRRWTASPSSLTFIGRPDADGWMPWAGGENPVPGQMVEVKFEGGIVSEVLDSECFGWDRHKDPVVASLYDIIAFRLAPTAPVEAPSTYEEVLREGQKERGLSVPELPSTAPVEASGSEREIDLYDDKVQEGIAWTMRQWGETLGLTTWTQGDGSESVEGDVGTEIHTILVDAGLRDSETNEMAALRPQPSGETREAVAHEIYEFLDERFPDGALPGGVQLFADPGDSTDANMNHEAGCFALADRILALLSARPLALGGQHSSGEAAGCAESEVGRAVYERIEKLIDAKPGTPEGDELSFLAFLVESVEEVGGYDGPSASTPARAEAQDEGAEMTRLLKLADSALANVTAFEDDARYIMGNTNYAITENARSEIRSFLLAQSAKTSVRPKALEILERLLDHSGARGSFDAMKHGDAVKDAEELLRSARSPGHTDLMVTPESIDAYMKVNPMEDQDEGAAGEREALALDNLANAAEVVRRLLHKTKEVQGPSFREAGISFSTAIDHARAVLRQRDALLAHPSPAPAADADRVLRDAVEKELADVEYVPGDHPIVPVKHDRFVKAIRSALKSEGK